MGVLDSMKNINFKKLIPGLTSTVIVVALAVSTLTTFATNVDLEAFVTHEDFETKYNEIKYRINEIDKDLERTYKFVCTNVRTYSGGTYTTGTGYRAPFNFWNAWYQYHWGNWTGVDLSDPKALRFGSAGGINSYAGHANTQKLVYEVPLSLCKVREGTEFYPHSTVKYELTRNWANVANSTPVSSLNLEVIMGPFKKLPRISTTGSTLTTGYLLEMPYPVSRYGITGTAFYYAQNSETQPTSWTSDTGRTVCDSTFRGYQNYSQFDRITAEEIEANPYDKYTKLKQTQRIYFSTVPAVNFSTLNDNIWLRMVYTATNTMSVDRGLNTDFLTITTWNTGK